MTSPLISCEQLAARLNDRDLCIVDCRHQLSDTSHGERVYAEGHIPGAFFMHLDRDLSGPMNGRNGRHPLPDPQTLVRRLGAIGISRQTTVVVYDDAEGMVAGRVWWMLRWLGHDNVAILDGGFTRWAKQGLPVETAQQPLPIFRQIQIGAGGLVLVGVLGSLVWPSMLWLSAFVGAGLVFAGVTGFCGLGLLLAAMPWNKK